VKSFSELTRKEKSIELLRWVLIPCVGVLIGRVIPRLITVLLWWPIITHIHLSRIGPVSHWKMETSRLLLVSIVLGAAFVVAGAKMAPRARVMTAFVLGTFWTLHWFYEAFFAWVHWVQEDMDDLLNATTRSERDTTLNVDPSDNSEAETHRYKTDAEAFVTAIEE
jgi:membrane-bound acyltransferase YfiQ involved in biofilm formation